MFLSKSFGSKVRGFEWIEKLLVGNQNFDQKIDQETDCLSAAQPLVSGTVSHALQQLDRIALGWETPGGAGIGYSVFVSFSMRLLLSKC